MLLFHVNDTTFEFKLLELSESLSVRYRNIKILLLLRTLEYFYTEKLLTAESYQGDVTVDS